MIRTGRRCATWAPLAAGLALATHCLAPAAAAPRAPEAIRSTTSVSAAAERFEALPVRFEPNVGQFDGGVEFVARGAGYTLFLTPGESVVACGQAGGEAPRAESSVVRTRLEGASTRARGEGVDELPGVTNYFVGNDPSRWRTGIVSYGAVRYREVYPGIDLVYYGTGSDVEYDFVVAPGVDPSAIRMRVEGAERVRVDDVGDLVLEVAGGELRQRTPVIYQEGASGRERVAGGYVVAGDEVTFEVDAYDASRPLVLDPVIAYSRVLDYTPEDSARAIAVGTDGSAYVAGYVIVGISPFRNNAFVTKLDPTGSQVYHTILGGANTEYGNALALGADGSAYVAGYTNSPNFPTASPLQANLGGSYDAFVAKLSPSGSTLTYSTYLGGTGGDSASGIAVLADGSAYVTGDTGSTNFPTASPLQANNAGNGDAFVTKLSPSGSALVYSTYLGGSDWDRANGIAVGADGSAYVAGGTSSTNFPGPRTFGPLGSGGSFVAKLVPSGSSLVYSAVIVNCSAYGIAVGADGSAYVTGGAWEGLPIVNAVQATFGGGSSDAFVTKLSPSGSSLVYSTYLGGANSAGQPGDWGYAIAVSADGSAHVAGHTTSSDFPTAAPVQASLAGFEDAFVTKLSASGSSLVYSTYLGTVGSEFGLGIAVGADNSAYVVGTTAELIDFIDDAVVTKITPGTSTTPGVYVPSTGFFFLKNANTAGAADLQFAFGVGGAGYVPLAGDWNADTIDTVGLYHPPTSVFFLKNTSANGLADLTFTLGVGGLGYVPVTGDWNGDGVETVGLYRPQTGVFFLKNANANGPADVTFSFGAGGAGYVPLAGDWDGDGTDTVGLYEPATSTFFLTNANASGPADVTFAFGVGGLGYVPVTGDWDGDGSDTVALYRPATAVFFLSNANAPGAADLTFVYGPPNATPLAGDWDGL